MKPYVSIRVLQPFDRESYWYDDPRRGKRNGKRSSHAWKDYRGSARLEGHKIIREELEAIFGKDAEGKIYITPRSQRWWKLWKKEEKKPPRIERSKFLFFDYEAVEQGMWNSYVENLREEQLNEAYREESEYYDDSPWDDMVSDGQHDHIDDDFTFEQYGGYDRYGRNGHMKNILQYNVPLTSHNIDKLGDAIWYDHDYLLGPFAPSFNWDEDFEATDRYEATGEMIDSEYYDRLDSANQEWNDREYRDDPYFLVKLSRANLRVRW
jgi:hypothetical protein